MKPLMKVGIAGLGAIGGTVARALIAGIGGMALHRVSDPRRPADYGVPYVDLETLAKECDLIVECLPAKVVPELCRHAFQYGKDIVVITSAALLIYPEILHQKKVTNGRIIVSSGAIAGIDGIQSLVQNSVKSIQITSIKNPAGLGSAPYILEKKINLGLIKKKQMLFSGNALEAARAFPANANVAATLSLAGIGPLRTKVEIWADPDTAANTHEITAEGAFSRITARVENTPDPANPKTSLLAAQSIIAVLRGMTAPLAVL